MGFTVAVYSVSAAWRLPEMFAHLIAHSSRSHFDTAKIVVLVLSENTFSEK
jgi:hypothetical protein